MYIFDWDEKKNEINLRKHGISFPTATLAFRDPYRLTEEDSVVDGELRWKTVGVALGIVVILVVHLEEDFGEDIYVRLISARKAEAYERIEYDANHPHDI